MRVTIPSRGCADGKGDKDVRISSIFCNVHRIVCKTFCYIHIFIALILLYVNNLFVYLFYSGQHVDNCTDFVGACIVRWRSYVSYMEAHDASERCAVIDL